jgi:hypothetical protein
LPLDCAKHPEDWLGMQWQRYFKVQKVPKKDDILYYNPPI